MKRNILTIVIGAVLIVIFALLLFVFQVRQSEVAVVTTFGKPVRNLTEAGRVFQMAVADPEGLQVRPARPEFRGQVQPDTHGGQQQSADERLYRLEDFRRERRFSRNSPAAPCPPRSGMLESMLRSAKSAVIGQHTLSDFVNADPQELKFDAIENEIEQSVQARVADEQLRHQLEFLGFKKIDLPESVTQTVFDRMTSERQVLISQRQYEGEAEAQKIKSAADRQAAETVANAEAAATRIRGEGEAEAAKMLPVFQQNPELANFLLRIDALKQSLNQRSTLIFDERTPPFDLFQHLPTNAPSQYHERRARTSRSRARTGRAGGAGRRRFAGAGRGVAQQFCDRQSRRWC